MWPRDGLHVGANPSSDFLVAYVFDVVMDGPFPAPEAQETSPFRLFVPERPFSPMVFTSPHSGRAYSADLMPGVRLTMPKLRRSEDSFVEDLFCAAPDHGAPLLAANFPRAFCDVNREAWELDPAMFADPLPDWVNTRSARVSAGLGTIARVVASGEPIYHSKLAFAEAERRICTYWRPYHTALAHLIAETKQRFGYCLLIDCHSMPAAGQIRRANDIRPDVILGDLHGSSCSSRVTRAAETLLTQQGLAVRRNDPYAGGYITRHYGRPIDDVHVLQIEVARSLYMDEAQFERLPSFAAMRERMTALVAGLARQVHDLIG
jgi:N-formylglutamate amidohydrolase